VLSKDLYAADLIQKDQLKNINP